MIFTTKYQENIFPIGLITIHEFINTSLVSLLQNDSFVPLIFICTLGKEVFLFYRFFTSEELRFASLKVECLYKIFGIKGLVQFCSRESYNL